jgi:hypothetical protein
MFSSNTFVETLSTIFTQSLSSFHAADWQNVKEDLATLTHTVTSLEQTVECCLSSIPTHPYERLKYNYFGPEYQFKTLEDLEEPEKIPYEKCLEYVRLKNEEVLFTTFHNLTCEEENKIYTAFMCCSGDRFIPDHKKQKKYIEFLELAKNIPLTSITSENCNSIAKKLIAEYMRVI